MRSPQSEVTSAPKAPATVAEKSASQGRRPAHPRDGLLHMQGRYGNRRAQGIIQAKLNVGPVDDPLEREADRVARLATGASPSASAQRAPEVVRHVPEATGGTADPAVAQAVQRARGGGLAVPRGVRERMERATGADFGSVRLHVSSESDRLNDALGSRAFTVGADVFVRRSEYRPGTARGDALLGHELTHTVQQGAAGPGRGAVPMTTAQRNVDDPTDEDLPVGGDTDQVQDQALPTVTVEFSMSGKQHEMVLKPVGDDVDVLVTSGNENLMPLGDEYTKAYNNIEYLKSYVKKVENKNVRANFENEMLNNVVKFQKSSVAAYKKAFKKAFPHRPDEKVKPSEKVEGEVAIAVSELLAELGKMNKEITAWANGAGLEGFDGEDFEKMATEKGEKFWKAEYDDIKAIINGVLANEQYEGKRLQYMGSLRRGTRGPHKGRTAFNVDDFDVDLFVVHPEKWDAIYDKVKKLYPAEVDGEKLFPNAVRPYLNDLIVRGEEVGGKLADALVGRLKDVSEIRNKTDIVLRRVKPGKKVGEGVE